MTKRLGVAELVFFTIAIRKLLKTHHHSKDRRKILIAGVLLLLGCFSMIFSSGSMTEKEYIQEVSSIFASCDEKIKQTDVDSNDSLKDTADYLSKQMKRLDGIKPSSTLPQEIKDSHETLYKGMDRIRTGILKYDIETIQEGQTLVSVASIPYTTYIEKNQDKFNKE